MLALRSCVVSTKPKREKGLKSFTPNCQQKGSGGASNMRCNNNTQSWEEKHGNVRLSSLVLDKYPCHK